MGSSYDRELVQQNRNMGERIKDMKDLQILTLLLILILIGLYFIRG